MTNRRRRACSHPFRLHARFATASPVYAVTEYYIPRHVHFAIEGDAVVFLDLKADQYSMMLGTRVRIFLALLSRTSDSIQRTIRDDPPTDAANPHAAGSVITELLEQRLLTTEPDRTAPPLPVQITFPQKSLLDPLARRLGQVTARDMCRFAFANGVARWKLRYNSIERTVNSVERRSRIGRRANPMNLDEARQLVSVYNRLRPFCTQASMCLLDSLTLLEFLAKYKCYPSWVFAVQFEPWAAHCWVQYDAVAFNQDAEAARTYLPLMIV